MTNNDLIYTQPLCLFFKSRPIMILKRKANRFKAEFFFQKHSTIAAIICNCAVLNCICKYRITINYHQKVKIKMIMSYTGNVRDNIQETIDLRATRLVLLYEQIYLLIKSRLYNLFRLK